jgi:hypothetical protein
MSISSLPSSVISMYEVVPEMVVSRLGSDGFEDATKEFAADRAEAEAAAAAAAAQEKLEADRWFIEEQLADIKTDCETNSVRCNELAEYALVLDNKSKNLKFRELELDERIRAFDTKNKLFMHQHHIFMKQKRLSNKVLMKQAMKKKQQLKQQPIVTRSKAKRINNYGQKLTC